MSEAVHLIESNRLGVEVGVGVGRDGGGKGRGGRMSSITTIGCTAEALISSSCHGIQIFEFI